MSAFSEKELKESPTPEKFGLLSRYFAMEPQERQIQRMVKRAEQHNQAVTTAYSPIQNYLSTVNGFLQDSGKSLAFSKTGRLHVMRGQSALGGLSALSSGERQLVVILTHMAFSSRARAASVLIVDEPELSLHLRWQEMFVDALQASDPSIQLILATHSPSIIMDRVTACVDLSEAK